MTCRTPCSNYNPNMEHTDCTWSNGEQCMREILTEGDIKEIEAKAVKPTPKEIKDIERFVRWMNKNLILGKHLKLIPSNITNIYFEDINKLNK